MNGQIKSTIFNKLPRIKGYLDILDARIFAEIASTHHEMGSEGAVAEIGIFYGRSFFLLHTLYPDANKLGIDLYDIGATSTHLSQIDQIMAYNETFRFGLTRDMLLKADSTRLDKDAILDRVGRVKLFSIDGGHALHHAAHDAMLAHETLTEDGVIVFDDSFSPEWPEVTVAIIDFLRQHTDFAAFCISDKKLYACRTAYRAAFRAGLAGLTQTFGDQTRSFLGHEALVLHHPIEKKAAARLMSKLGFGAASSNLYGTWDYAPARTGGMPVRPKG